ncbi:ABC transporter ATP-binding protein [Nitratireductor aquimarinus]|uniref:ABC transporter ATP-binding protein n=1 Tax=Nitratireductor aquimarinus TaxID=889300 RepID=UPI001A903C46|nr:ATP-binding cassette domain-containing protein [Nitratireductor aquimarinus]MBN8245752.1 ABC transporter ATP-binding protein [Nitratireductor aquimarinus]MBY6134134.1 ATP-binding cassette domain-containing protein [Nitratireductor aquimarinus]MCA1305234.1 ATP-binding cassette domain-containing protein [Nitratireductor aquimarinus]
MTLEIRNVTKIFPGRREGFFSRAEGFKALDHINLSVRKGASFGLVGESGSGKTTLTRCILRLESLTSGSVLFNGDDIHALGAKEMRRLRSRMQIVFQDPYASLNPRMTIHDIVAEPMVIHHDTVGLNARQRTEKVVELLLQVGLRTEHLFRHPHEFSGGQRQRIGIARALAVGPELLILDEPTSALDVSVQAEVLNLLHRLQDELGLTYFFISHDLGVIRYICDEVAVIYRGKIVEQGPVGEIFDAPQNDYTRVLLDAMPDPDPERSPFRRSA